MVAQDEKSALHTPGWSTCLISGPEPGGLPGSPTPGTGREGGPAGGPVLLLLARKVSRGWVSSFTALSIVETLRSRARIVWNLCVPVCRHQPRCFLTRFELDFSGKQAMYSRTLSSFPGPVSWSEGPVCHFPFNVDEVGLVPAQIRMLIYFIFSFWP